MNLKNIQMEEIWYKFLGILLGFFVFIPNKIKPYFVALSIITSIFSYINNRNKNKNFIKVLPISILFFLYTISLVNSDNLDYGLKIIGRMTPLLFLPFSIFLMEDQKRKYLFIYFKKYFVISLFCFSICIFIYLFSLGTFTGESSLNYGYSYITNEFYGINDHPIYLSTYISVGLLFMLEEKRKTNFIHIIIYLVILLGLLILSRKGSIISFFVCFFLFLIRDKKNWLLIAVSTTVFFVVLYSFSGINERFKEMIVATKIKNNTETSSGIRLIVWENALKTAFNRNYFGYGVGDVQTILDNSYINNGYKKIADEHYNTHNQYLQTALTIGIVGLFIFVFCLLFLMFKFICEKEYLSGLILLFFLLTFLFESYLERQNGIIFFSLIISLLTFTRNAK